MRIVRRVVSPIGVLLAFLAGAWALHWLTAGSLTAVRDGALTFDALLVFVVAVLAWACFAWLALGTVLMALSALPGAIGAACGSLAERVTPAFYRRAARVALGLSVAAGPVLGSLPANAATVDQPTQAAAAAQMLPGLDRPGTIDSQLPGGIQLPDLDRPGGTNIRDAQLPMPDRPSSVSSGRIGFDRAGLPNPDRPATADPVTRAPVRGADSQQQVVVKRGDNLWNIAKQHLPENAGNAEINREWHRWYDANRQVIGDNPDLIQPGQILTPPQS
ncbi:LysM domain-containing protein [Actinopolymorpha cephalotaxi]|uniref:LysM domain-containing protein n=1 Tax=Actinopolymorpha cephalotaxi TaxID=504797 RepID=A0A1I2KK60_9ACTN|nr:LysM peptidoglycan-binding domain-containing protein [Actinopolymorpha cephalotaxi]NYH84506.1 nucleoid-associated protein YgaU [Actinopolymorpha cephalotaxi]SFF67365.1 LysM domain-containing protein [Actinopolymorpha cephalotaxi]